MLLDLLLDALVGKGDGVRVAQLLTKASFVPFESELCEWDGEDESVRAKEWSIDQRSSVGEIRHRYDSVVWNHQLRLRRPSEPQAILKIRTSRPRANFNYVRVAEVEEPA